MNESAIKDIANQQLPLNTALRGFVNQTNYINIGVITKGLTQYEVFQNNIMIPILRATGQISNPKNPARTTPAGPPIRVAGAQQLGLNSAEFSIGFFDIKDWACYVEEVYPETIVF